MTGGVFVSAAKPLTILKEVLVTTILSSPDHFLPVDDSKCLAIFVFFLLLSSSLLLPTGLIDSVKMLYLSTVKGTSRARC